MEIRGIRHALLLAAVLAVSGSVLHAQAGDGWRLLTTRHFTPRFAAAAAVFHDRLWLIGGGLDYGEGMPAVNDVWSSADGSVWEPVAMDPPFPPRAGGTALVFQGKLWLFGGENTDSYLDWGGGLQDLWSSADGRAWEEVRLPFAAVEDARVRGYLFQGSFWLTLHGKDGAVRFFRSADGTGWTEAGSAKIPEATSFWEAGGSAWASSGTNDRIDSEKALWKSADGVSWRKAAEDFSPAFEAAPISLRGGLLGAEQGCIWQSADGVEWREATSPADGMWTGDLSTAAKGYTRYQKREYALVAFRDSAWMLGGRMLEASASGGVATGYDVATSEVWASADGRSWTRKAGLDRPSGGAAAMPAAAMPARSGHALVSFHGAFHLTGGMFGQSYYADCWKSADGKTWNALTPVKAFWAYSGASAPASATMFPPRKNHAMAVFKDRIWVVAGRVRARDRDADPFVADVWSSADGATWRREVDKAPFPAREGHGLVVHGGELVLYGGVGWNGQKKTAEALGDAWASADGVSWRRLEQGEARLPAGGFFGAASFQGKLWRAGGSFDKEGKWYSTWSVFSSADGRDWKAEASLPAPWESGACLTAGSRLVLLGGFSNGNADLVWTTADGALWSSVDLPRRFDPSWGAAAAVLGDTILYTGGNTDREGPPLGTAWALPLGAVEAFDGR